MKKVILLLLLSYCFTTHIHAQADSYQSFEWDIIRLGYAVPFQDSLSGGVAISGEIRYNIKNNISTGLRAEFAFFGSNVDASGIDIGASGSYTLFGDYYFSNTSSKRFFTGLGVGYFQGVTSSFSNTPDIDAGSTIGVVPRVGYELGFIRLSAEYNLTFDKAASNYLGLNLGFTLWGRYKG